MKTIVALLLSSLVVASVVSRQAHDINEYFSAAFDNRGSLTDWTPPPCSEGVKIIARAQEVSKSNAPEGWKAAVDLINEYLKSATPSWETDFLKLMLPPLNRSYGNLEESAKSAEEALTSVDFTRLQNGSDPALRWLRGKFGREHFTSSSKDYLHRLAAWYYRDSTIPPDYEAAKRHFEQISDEKDRIMELRQLASRMGEAPPVFPAKKRPPGQKVVSSIVKVTRHPQDHWPTIIAVLAIVVGLLVWIDVRRSRTRNAKWHQSREEQ